MSSIELFAASQGMWVDFASDIDPSLQIQCVSGREYDAWAPSTSNGISSLYARARHQVYDLELPGLPKNDLYIFRVFLETRKMKPGNFDAPSLNHAPKS